MGGGGPHGRRVDGRPHPNEDGSQGSGRGTSMSNVDAHAAGRLVALGLQPRAMPGRDSEYATLIGRYQNETPFADLVAGIAEGQGLKILGNDRITGLVVAPASDGE